MEPVELDIADPHFMATAHELYADLRAKGGPSTASVSPAWSKRCRMTAQRSSAASWSISSPSSSPTMTRLLKPYSTTASQ